MMRVLLISLFGLALGVFSAQAQEPILRNGKPQMCTSSAQCSDGIYCNGEEICTAREGRTGVCVAGDAPCSGPDSDCSEVNQVCYGTCPDDDGDGYQAASCGGTDCDDTNPNRFPGNAEVCDAQNLDEDCDPTTVGELDADGDGFTDMACFVPFN